MGINKTAFQRVDTSAFLWCQRYLNRPALYPYIRAISATGDGWLYPLLAFYLLSVGFSSHLNFFYSCLIGFGLEVPLYLILKKKFKRNRPQQSLIGFQAKIKPSDRFSFPSGHTAGAFVMASQVMVFFPLFAPIAIVWALAIGMSRVALGVHFPGDIIAGTFLGLLSGALASSLVL